MISRISSRTNPKIVYASKLKTKEGIKEHNEFLVEGFKSIELALKAGLVKEVFTLRVLDIDDNIPQYLVNESIIEKISFSKNPEGIVTIVKTLPNIKPKKFNKVVYLDNVQDPGNMGTIIRTALAFNYDGIILSEDCVSIYNSKVVAASKGAIFLLPIIHGELSEFKKDHVVITSTLNDKSIPLKELNNDKPFILVLGNEAHGVREEIIKQSDIFVKIPIENIDSLNVAIAGAILMHHLK